MSEKKICSKCVMDTTDSKITFDIHGICDHCKTFEEKIMPFWNPSSDSKKELETIINQIKSRQKNKDFDCIMGMSGGIDSSYLLHMMVTEFGLKPLVFHVDAGWNTQIAVNNIEKIVDGLNLDLYTEVINWEEMKDLQRAFFKSGVPHMDTPQDHAFFATMYKFANKHNINNILTGGNYSTECIRNPLDWMWYQSDSIQIKDIHSRFGEMPLKSFPLTNILWYKFYLPIIKNIRVLRPLDFIPYDKEKAITELENTYGYQRYPQKHFESRFTKFYESYWLFERFGFDVRKVQYSSLILTGQMTREKALENLKSKPYTKDYINKEFEYVANKLDFSKEELRDLFDLPLKSYKDYKSQETIFRIGAKVLKAIGVEKGGKR
jgi:N-acetyl sugar amidotransferase